jgi:hypothetical protein
MFVILILDPFPLSLTLMPWNASVSPGKEGRSYHPILGEDYKLGFKPSNKATSNIIFSMLLMANIFSK